MSKRRQRSHRPPGMYLLRSEAGLTLVELMISVALSLFVVLAATALLVSTKSGYIAQDDNVQIQDTGRYAIAVIARAVRQAAYENWDGVAAQDVSAFFAEPGVSGLDARSLKSRSPGIESPLTRSVNGSDVLAIRFSGSGIGDNGDGTMLNCAGFGVGATPAEGGSRGWSIFYVAEDATGEPELYCKYRGDTNWTSQSIARGIESFQVLYGIDLDGDGLPNRLLNAADVQALDDALVLQEANSAERAADKKRKTHWNKVVMIKIGLLVRGAHTAQSASKVREYNLLGRDYANGHAASDAGVRIRESDLPKAARGRERRIFAATLWLRNHVGESVS